MSLFFSRTLGAAVLAFSLLGSAAFADLKAGGAYNSLYAGIGAKGYDVVSYFTDGRPEKGSESYVVEFGGVKWQFASSAHRDLFKAKPEKYVPQFGGFCTWGVANGKLFDVDPASGWKIVDGKLYLNFNADIEKVFDKDPAGFIARANSHWAQL